MKPFSTTMKVRVGDVNYGGHLGNDKVLLYFQEARIRFFAEHGLSEMNIGDNVSITQIESLVQYKGEAFLADTLKVIVLTQEAGRLRFKLGFRIVRESDDQLIAVGHTELAGFNYKTRKPARLPESFKKLLIENKE